MLNIASGSCTLSQEDLRRDLRSPLLLCAAILITAAAVLAVPVMLTQVFLEGRDAFFLKLLIEEIDPGSYQEWFALHTFIYSLGLIGPLLLAAGLWITVLSSRSHSNKGLAAGPGYFRGLARVYHVASWAIALFLSGLFLVRVILYFLAEAFQVGGFLFIAAMLLPELVFAAVAAIVVVTAVRWTKRAIHTVENIRYNFLSGECRSYSMSGSTASAFFLTGVFALAIALLHWGDLLPMLVFGLTFAGDLLTGLWIRGYLRKTDRRIYAAQRMAEGKNISFKL